MADLNSSLPIRTENAGDAIVKVADATITSQQLKVNSDGSTDARVADSVGNLVTSTLVGGKRGLDANLIDNTVKQGGKSSIAFVRNNYLSVNVTTTAYVQLIASTSGIVNEIEIFDSSGKTLKLAFGAAGFEIDQIIIIPGGNGRIPLYIPAGTRISIEAISATANKGEININLYS